MKIRQIYQPSRLISFLILLTISVTTAACTALGRRPEKTPTIIEDPDREAGIHLEAELSVLETIPLCNPVLVTFKVSNPTDQPLYLLNWYTPLEGILGDIFQVTYAGQELPYLGPQVMRVAPLEDQYTQILGGESVTAAVDLSKAYDLSRIGHYTITFKSPLISDVVRDPSAFATSVDELGPVQISSQPVEMAILPSENGARDCEGPPQAGSIDATQQSPKPNMIILTGIVKNVSLSARIIWLEEDVDGFSTIVLTEDSTVTKTNGDPLELGQIVQGLIVEAAGQPGEQGSLLADSVQVIPPEGK